MSNHTKNQIDIGTIFISAILAFIGIGLLIDPNWMGLKIFVLIFSTLIGWIIKNVIIFTLENGFDIRYNEKIGYTYNHKFTKKQFNMIMNFVQFFFTALLTIIIDDLISEKLGSFASNFAQSKIPIPLGIALTVFSISILFFGQDIIKQINAIKKSIRN